MIHRYCRGVLVGISILGLTASASAVETSAEEKRIVSVVERQSGEAISLLEKVVNIPSETHNLEGVRKVGAAFRAEFDHLGFKTRWADMPAEMRRAGHLIAEREGTRGKRILLIGHLDTVLEGVPFSKNGNRAAGNGVSDMKGGDVILLFALKALYEAGELTDRRIIVAMTGDEEDAGLPLETSRKDLIDAAKQSDLALAFEEVIEHTATVARRGVSNWRLDVEGRTGHSSGIFSRSVGDGAIFETARILEAFRLEVREKDLTFNPSIILGGTTVDHDSHRKRGTAEGKTNVRPSNVIVEGDLRFISPEQKKKAEDKMRGIVERHLPQTKATITFSDEYPAMAPSPGNYEALEVLSKTSQDLGMGPIRALPPGRRGAGDISFVSPPIPGLDGLGSNGGSTHTKNEFLDLASFPDQIKRASIFLYRLTREPGAKPEGTIEKR